MSPLGLLALLFALVTFGGGAVVYLYDLLEARMAGAPATGGGGKARRGARLRRLTPARSGRLPRGVVVTVRAGSAPVERAGRGEPVAR